MLTLLVSPDLMILADREARDHRDAVLAMMDRYDLVLLDAKHDRWHDLLRLVRDGILPLPGQITVVAHDQGLGDEIRTEVRKIYAAAGKGGGPVLRLAAVPDSEEVQ